MAPHAPAAASGLRRGRFSRGSCFLSALAAVGSATLWLSSPVPSESFVATAGMRALSGLSAARGSTDEHESPVAMHDQLGGRKFRGSARFESYEGFVYKRKHQNGLRIRLARYGRVRLAFYKILVQFQQSKQSKSGRFLEEIGFWDPLKEMDDERAFKIKADRAVYWLRAGANPTDQVASLLDISGLIRRTGKESQLGMWDWRVDKQSGPEAPEGWKFNMPQRVTWGNRPMVNHRKGHPHNPEKIRKLPLIERYGFKGYTRIPIEGDIITEPVTKSALLEAFGNVQLPMY
ncbi:unnamed protein product [Polarella glacialis]|uniref:30S ribosomal protein S16 n=1 Tax=Polarella glacialis TaxID=89957 RepID=A0A813ESV2_POLGL|nr:unnamed protein product [Polarella glacialis]